MFAIESGWTAEEPGYYMTDEFARDVVAGWRTDKADKETYKRASECYHAQWQAALSDLNSTIATFEQAQETERAAYRKAIQRARGIGFGPFAGIGYASNGDIEACVGLGLVWKIF